MQIVLCIGTEGRVAQQSNSRATRERREEDYICIRAVRESLDINKTGALAV